MSGKKTFRRVVAAAAATLFILLSVYETCYAAVDWGDYPLYWPVTEGWYVDIPGQWEYEVLYPLWKKRIISADYVYRNYNPRKDRHEYYWYFHPYDNATRLWYGQCLIEPYGRPTDYSVRVPGTNTYWKVFYNHKVRWFAPYANKMAEKGLISWSKTFVDGYIRRDEAFSWAIRAAGLGPQAQAMSDSEVNKYLNQFPDGWKTLPEYRKDMAFAIKLGVAQGYQSGYLGPDDHLIRSHAAAIILRTASVRAWTPSVMEYGSTLSIYPHYVSFGSVKQWAYYIYKWYSNGTKKYVYGYKRYSSSVPSRIVWDGEDSRGYRQYPGTYSVEVEIKFETNGSYYTYRSLPKFFKIVQDYRYLNADLYSGTVPDGGKVYFKPRYYSEATPTIEARYNNTGDWQSPASVGSGWYSLPAPAVGSNTLNLKAKLYQDGFGWDYFYKSKSFTVERTSASISTNKTTFVAGESLSITVTASPGSPSWGYTSTKVYVKRVSDGAVVRTLSGSSVAWDGKDSSGNYCETGTYRLEGQVTFYQNVPSGTQPQWARSASKDVTFISWEISNVQLTAITNAPPGNPSLPTGSFPILVTPSSQVTVKCDTVGPAQQVKFRVGSTAYDGTPQYARGSMNNTWTAMVSPGTSQHAATVNLTVELYDSSGILRKTYGPVSLMVVDGRSVSASSSASLSGTYAVSGGKAYILVDVVGTLKSGPVVSGFGQNVTAAWDAARGKYVAVLNVPESTTDGNYTVLASAVLSMSGWPDRTVSATTTVPVKKEVLSVTASPEQFAPRLGTPLTIQASLRPVTTPASSVLTVKDPGGTVVYTKLYSGLPSTMYWDGKDSSGNYCDAGGFYIVAVTATCTYDPGAGFPAGTVQVAGSDTVELPNVTTTEEDPGSVIIIE